MYQRKDHHTLSYKTLSNVYTLHVPHETLSLQLVNKSIEQRKFAKNWKPQLVKPLHKKKEKTLVGNFRPVSNLVEVGKVAEYAVAEQIITHL